MSFPDWMSGHAACIERALETALPAADAHPVPLHDAMRYAVLGGGKRIRPLLVLAAGEAVGAPQAALVAAGCAVELIHAYSLVHDDLPCMDDDILRRGRPTVHVVWGEALAMLVGDALQAMAFEVLAGVDRPGAARMVAELAAAAGSRGMAGGQAIDLAAVGGPMTQAALEDMHRRKTGALLRASVRLGAMCGDAPAEALARPGAGDTHSRLDDARARLDQYAEAIGLAFQVVDDILDVEGDAATLGKTAGKDADSNKPTYVSVLGLAESRRMAADLHASALSAIAPLGEAGRRLRELADLIVLRRS
ncbi:polyprenyl synthetase family protein [Zeimonas arvi]|uniref:Polyprenyl synthetase family protein n=1 Tax=Zeimonas arvi TaxID=2498847 RepID=A0A5C8P6J4_9BURK|nr:farnesyl diphosphate synthase [Zeimonas arvi]TXL68943.1 polyprenyl synthetase family protein [Zeimonas arvi]